MSGAETRQAMVILNRMAIKYHLQCIRIFTDGMLIPPELAESMRNIDEGCGSNPTVYSDALNSMLDHLVRQLSHPNWSQNFTGDVVKHILAGLQLYFVILQKDQVVVQMPIHELVMCLHSQLKEVKKPAAEKYLRYCTNIICINIIRICKLVMDFNNPEMSDLMCKVVQKMEMDSNTPYITANQGTTERERRMNYYVSNMMQTMGKNWLGEVVDEHCLSKIEDENMEDMHTLFNHLTPHLKGICSTIKGTIESASEKGSQMDLPGVIREAIIKSSPLGQVVINSDAGLSQADMMDQSDRDIMHPADKKLKLN